MRVIVEAIPELFKSYFKYRPTDKSISTKKQNNYLHKPNSFNGAHTLYSPPNTICVLVLERMLNNVHIFKVPWRRDLIWSCYSRHFKVTFRGAYFWN